MTATSATGMTRDRQIPGRRWLGAVLAVSVALNLCVVAGVVWSRLHPPPPPPTFSQRFHQLGDTLNLTPAQQAIFDSYINNMTARGDRMRQAVEPIMDAAWAELAKPDADQAHVLQLLDDAGNQRRTFLREAVSATSALLATLTPEQRAKFVAAEREYHAAQRRRHAEEAH